VTQDELKTMMASPDLLFSPWFRIITNRWLNTWWSELNVTMTTDKHCDYTTISAFDPPAEHMGGEGDAGPMFADNDST
jgi:hypothetical protein